MRWAADDTLVFLSYRDGWPHLYSIHHPTEGGRPMLLTPGPFMVEQVTLTPDRFVNKGPHRPAFPERLRAEALASLACVDFVVGFEEDTPERLMALLRPAVLVKGPEYAGREDIPGPRWCRGCSSPC